MRRKTPLDRLSDRSCYDSSYYRAVARVAALLLIHPQGIRVGEGAAQVDATLDQLVADGEVIVVGDAYTIASAMVGLFGAEAFDNLASARY